MNNPGRTLYGRPRGRFAAIVPGILIALSISVAIPQDLPHPDDVLPDLGGPVAVYPPSPSLDENCVVSVLNRVAQARPDATWTVQNVPTNFGPVRARVTCVGDDQTISGESELFTVPPDGTVAVGEITFDSITPIPTRLDVIFDATLIEVGATAPVTVEGVFEGGVTVDLTFDNGTTYSSSNPAIAEVGENGVVTAASSGVTIVTVLNEGVSGFVLVPVVLASMDADGDGIPDDVELANGLDPSNPVDALEDVDADGLSTGDELLLYGTDPRIADVDGDGILDGEEVLAGDDGFVTNPLVVDTDGDGLGDGLEIATGSDPTDASSFNLAAALDSIEVSPANVLLTVNTVLGEASQRLTVTGALIDGSIIDLTRTTTGTEYSSSDLTVCNFGSTDGQVFAGQDGACTITVINAGFTAASEFTVTTFAPQTFGFVDVPGLARGVAVDGHAFIASGTTGIVVVDVSNRAAPVVATVFDTPGDAHDIRIAGKTGFVADGNALCVLDLSDPLDPLSIGSIPLPGSVLDVAVGANRVYVAAGSAGLHVVDVADPALPLLLGSATIAGGANGVAVRQDASQAIVAGLSGLYVVDISDPSNPTVLGSVATGDARDVVVNGNFAYVADIVNSLTVVDISDPGAPVVLASTPRETGGLLLDIALAGSLVFGADVFFVNGVPIVDVGDPSFPVPRDILDFSTFRDDNGYGVAVDGGFVYLAGQHGAGSRLYVGQYLLLEDNGGVAPTVTVVSPAAGATAIEGFPLLISVAAEDDVSVVSVSVLVDGEVVATDASPPYDLLVDVPLGVTEITIGATAIDPGGNVGIADSLTLAVVPDPGTTVAGHVQDVDGAPVEDAAVVCSGHTGTTEASGDFSIPGVPTVRGSIRCEAAFATAAGIPQRAVSEPTAPVPGGITDVGTLQVLGGAAIVRNFDNSEIDALVGWLSDLGITADVFDEEGLTLEDLKTHALVIWDDLSFSASTNPNTMTLLADAWDAGVSLYFIGDDLAHQAVWQPAEPRASRWEAMIHLHRGANSGGNGTLNIVDTNHPVTNGPHGIVSDWLYGLDTDGVTRTLTGEVLLGRSGSHDVIVAFEDPAGGKKSLTQNVLAHFSQSAAARVETEKLFKNAVSWLLSLPN